VVGVLRRPRQELPLTLADSGEPLAVLSYVAVVAAPGALAYFLANGVLGAWVAPTRLFNAVIPGGWVRAPLPSLVMALLLYLLSLGAWAGAATAMALLAPLFGGIRDGRSAAKAAACSLTPLLLLETAELFSSVPYLSWLPGVALVGAAAWAAFLGGIALPLHLGTPDTRAPGHALASLGITLAVASVLYLLASSAVSSVWPAR
jgi:hypothetical protein